MCSGNFYSPKIKEDLIPVLFKLAKIEKKPMTKLVDGILRDELLIRGLINHDQASYTGRAIEGFNKEDSYGRNSYV